MSTEDSNGQSDGPASLMGLFEPPLDENRAPPESLTPRRVERETQEQEAQDDTTHEDAETHKAAELLGLFSYKDDRVDETNAHDTSSEVPELMDLFTPPPTTRISDESSPLMHNDSTRTITTDNRMPPTSGMPSVREVHTDSFSTDEQHHQDEKKKAKCQDFYTQLLQPTTYIGAFMFLLYQIVFSLTMGAAITRPHGGSPMLGIMAKMSASGVMFASVVYWWSLSDDVPALYPAVDLFCAPFLANLAAIVDDVLYNDENVSPQDNDAMFLATFTFLTCLGLAITATLLMLASVFKLANLGAFLPLPVLSGFFAAVGVLLWTLAVKIDTSGMSVGQVIFSGDWAIVENALAHHVPSLIAACAMKFLSPQSPFYVVAVIVGMIGLFYTYIGIAGLDLEDMVQRGWFWSKSDLVNHLMNSSHVGFEKWAPPAPAGWINSWAQGNVHWGAVQAGMSTAIALAFLYMIRCSLHGAALRKNIGLMERRVHANKVVTEENGHNDDQESITKPSIGSIPGPVRFRKRQVSEAVDLDFFATNVPTSHEATNIETKWVVTQSKPTKHTLTEILAQYAYSQYICAFVGGLAMTPSIGPSATLYSLGAESLAPQVGSVLLLSIFFLTNFQLVMFIPKPAFSSVLCLAAIDIMDGWFIKSFHKTQNKIEWLVNPFILIAAFSVGLLSAVFLGLALSTFFFVGSFYRSGVVKFAGNGISMRSTIERASNMATWLDENGDFIQILILQSYLFFGNATSVLNYVSSMFEEIDEDADELDASLFPPVPKVLVLDFSLVPGIDGSAVDVSFVGQVMSDLLSACSDHDCKVFLSGASPSIRKTLLLGGVKPDKPTKNHSQRKLRYFPDLDSAIGKAEDTLIELLYWFSHGSEYYGSRFAKGTGFQQCLSHIDEQHQTCSKDELAELAPYTHLVTLERGERLYEDKILVDRGIFFIQEGTLRIERSHDATNSLTRTRRSSAGTYNHFDSIGHLKARSGTVARQVAMLKDEKQYGMQTFRLARIGPGWVIGSYEMLSGEQAPGVTIAVDRCRLFYISFHDLEQLEKEKPMLILQLYKLLSKLEARRSDMHLGQFATLHNIMSSPSHNRPMTTRGILARQKP